ncbi:MAG: hypothetical protein R2746_12785 [Acidimicrobiales bacterium]
MASLDGAGQPTINVFANDLSSAKSGGRLSIRHAAAAPAVNVDMGYFPFSRMFSFFVNTYGPAENGQAADVTTAAGKYDLVVRVASSGARAAAVPRFPVTAGKLTAVYAVGVPGSTFACGPADRPLIPGSFLPVASAGDGWDHGGPATRPGLRRVRARDYGRAGGPLRPDRRRAAPPG